MPASPVVLPAAKKEPPPKTEALPPPPTITPATPAADTESVIPSPPPAPPPVPAKTPRRATQRPAAPAQPAAPVAPASPPAAPQAPATAPQLAIVLTAEQQRQYNSDIDQSIQRAEGNLRSIGNRQLSSEQQASSDEARNFIRQAQAARGSDLPAAKRLAERADVLAANLASSLR